MGNYKAKCWKKNKKPEETDKTEEVAVLVQKKEGQYDVNQNGSIEVDDEKKDEGGIVGVVIEDGDELEDQ